MAKVEVLIGTRRKTRGSPIFLLLLFSQGIHAYFSIYSPRYFLFFSDFLNLLGSKQCAKRDARAHPNSFFDLGWVQKSR
jgi:hypothetical protein